MMIVHITDSQMKVLIQIDFRLGSIIEGHGHGEVRKDMCGCILAFRLTLTYYW